MVKKSKWKENFLQRFLKSKHLLVLNHTFFLDKNIKTGLSIWEVPVSSFSTKPVHSIEISLRSQSLIQSFM